MVGAKPGAVVIDHMGRVDARLGDEHADFQALMRLLDAPHFWVKLSGIDRIDAHAPPDERYSRGVALARRLWCAHGDRCVWGSDWPHPNHTHIPNDAALVDAIAQIVPDEAAAKPCWWSTRSACTVSRNEPCWRRLDEDKWGRKKQPNIPLNTDNKNVIFHKKLNKCPRLQPSLTRLSV